MKGNSLLIVGCGDLGIRTGSTLLAEGWQVHGVRRNVDALPAGFVAHQGDYTNPEGLQGIRQLRPDTVLATFNPADRSLAGYQSGFADGARNLVEALGDHRPATVLFVSSTRVFAESDGGWVDETSALSGDDARAIAIIDAEQAMRDADLEVSIVRFAGIYGYSRGRMLERIGRGELSPASPARWTNRIHRDDCAGFLCHLLRAAVAGQPLAPVYIGVDDCPAPHFEVEAWLAGELGADVDSSPPAAGQGNPIGKRCNNQLLHSSGYALRYPDYRSGYRAVLAGSS